MTTLFEQAKERLERGQSMMPAAETVGFRLVSIESGRAVIELQTHGQHANPMGTVHGGVICDIADGAMGMAFLSTLAEEESFTTLEMKINFLRPVWNGTLHAIGTVVTRGRTVGMAQCDVVDEAERLVARASCTCFVLRGDQARGR